MIYWKRYLYRNMPMCGGILKVIFLNGKYILIQSDNLKATLGQISHYTLNPGEYSPDYCLKFNEFIREEVGEDLKKQKAYWFGKVYFYAIRTEDKYWKDTAASSERYVSNCLYYGEFRTKRPFYK